MMTIGGDNIILRELSRTKIDYCCDGCFVDSDVVHCLVSVVVEQPKSIFDFEQDCRFGVPDSFRQKNMSPKIVARPEVSFEPGLVVTNGLHRLDTTKSTVETNYAV